MSAGSDGASAAAAAPAAEQGHRDQPALETTFSPRVHEAFPCAGDSTNVLATTRTGLESTSATAGAGASLLMFLPDVNLNNQSAFAHSDQVTIPANHEAAYNDAVATLFGTSGIGAVYMPRIQCC